MKTVLITGTSTGVGFETALLFAKKGYKVYATMRNLEKAEALHKAIINENTTIEILQLDVQDNASINKAVSEVIEKSRKIDILVNNAGAGFAKTLEIATQKEIDWVTDVNYTGMVRVTKAVLPFMRKEKSGHIINISSVGGIVGQPFNELYCAAKFAMEGFTEALSSYISTPFNIHFSLIEPGGITTEFMNSAVAQSMTNGQLFQGAYQDIFNAYLAGTQKRTTESAEQTYQTGKEVAEVILQVAETENPPLRIRTSEWAENLCQLKTQADPDGTKLRNEVIERFLK